MSNASSTVSAKDRVLIFDTTLRDGEQCPGATMTFEEKLEVADMLDAMGVDIIEAGFPIASDGDFEAVSAIASRIRRASVAGLARAIPADIARAGEAVRHAAKPRIHTFVSTSPIHLQHQMRKSEEEVLEIIARTVTQARNLVEDVEWSGMDATRTPIDYLCRAVETAIRAGATTINAFDGGNETDRIVILEDTNGNFDLADTAQVSLAGGAAFSGPGSITLRLKRLASTTYAYELARVVY